MKISALKKLATSVAVATTVAVAGSGLPAVASEPATNLAQTYNVGRDTVVVPFSLAELLGCKNKKRFWCR